jgi:diguanylate cyclase (GGDEF)-like protein/PAS domain S-box-containing protein
MTDGDVRPSRGRIPAERRACKHMDAEPLRNHRLNEPISGRRRFPDKRQILWVAGISAAFLVFYLLLGRSDVLLESKLGFAIWYPPVGLSVAILLGLSPRYVPLVCIAEILAGRVIYHQPINSWTEMVIPVSVAFWYATAAYVLRDILHIDLELAQRRDVVRYAGVVLTAAMGSAAVGAMSLVFDHTVAADQYWKTAVNWYVGDAIALMGFAPFFLIHICPWIRRRTWEGRERTPRLAASAPEWKTESLLRMLAETLGQALSILAVLWIMFARPLGAYELYFLAFLPIIWIAMRQGIRQVVSGLLAFNFGVVLALQWVPEPSGQLIKTGVLMLSVSLIGLTVGSAVSERHRIANDLQERTTFLNALIESNPLGTVALDRDGCVQLCNDAFEKLFQYRRTEIVGFRLNDLIAPDEFQEVLGLAADPDKEGQPGQSVKRVRRDGTVLDVAVETVPLKLGGHVSGSFAIYKDVTEEIEAAELAREHSESLNRLVGELQLRTTQMTLLNEMSDLLQSCKSRKEAYSIITEWARKLFPLATTGALFTFRTSRNALEAVATWGKWPDLDYSPEPDECWALRRGRPNWSETRDAGIFCGHIRNEAAASYLCVPLVAQGNALGILHLQYDRSESARGTVVFETMQESQQRLAVSAAGQIALSLASLSMQETLRDQSVRDPLTGLYNRRFMQDNLERELTRAKRKNHPVAILFLDLDHFKKFNDTFGHDAGDFVLRSMADVFRQRFRGDDSVCRYGGEEFAIILPESTAANAERRANSLRMEVSGIRLRHQDQALDRVTISVGVAAFPENGANMEELLRAADQALYQSKADGRDRVTIAATQLV